MECCNSFLDESPVYFDIIPIAITLLFSSDWKNLTTIGFKIQLPSFIILIQNTLVTRFCEVQHQRLFFKMS